MDENINIRDRKSAVYDKKKSMLNYLKLDDTDENKKDRLKRLTAEGNNKIDSTIIEENNIDINLPKPPHFSLDTKHYSSNKDNNKLYLHSRATIISNFDTYSSLDSELSLINLENYFAKFDEDELSQLTVKDILTFDLKEFDVIKSKLQELLEVGLKTDDKEIIDFLEEKIKNVENNRNNINLVLTNLDNIEDFVIMNETLKFFFKNAKK